jgi:hypothetical protein
LLLTVAALAVCCLWGCSDQPDPDPIDPEESATPEATTAPELDDDDSATWPELERIPKIHYKPIGLSPMYVRFFADPAAMDRLGRDLGRTFDAESVAFEVSWNETEMSGAITLFVPENDRRGEEVADAIAAGEPVPAQRLKRLLAPVATYRGWLGARYDLRILSFDIRLAFWDRGTGGHCSIGGDIGDPEGKKVGPCFRCLDPREGGRVEVCRDGDSWPALLTGKKHVARQVESALRSDPL